MAKFLFQRAKNVKNFNIYKPFIPKSLNHHLLPIFFPSF